MIKKLWKKWIFPWRGESFRVRWYNLIRFPKNFCKFIGEVFFFLKHGYPYEATYDLYYYFINHMESILVDFTDGLHGCPCNIEQEEWEKILGDMIGALKGMDEIRYEKEIPIKADHNIKDVREYEEKKWKYLQNNKERFFELFSEWFYNLWD